MKKVLCSAMAVFLMTCILSACAPAAEDVPPEPSEQSVEPAMETAEPSSGTALNIADEPPLDEQSLSTAVPEFLDEEQQLLYRRAFCVYLHLFGGDTGEVNVWQKGDDYPDTINDVEHNGQFYTKACGRYAAWADFDALVHSVFTDEFWTQCNGGTFIDIDGDLYFIWASRGSYYYDDDTPDEFELISEDENEIVFTLIGHYRSPYEEEQYQRYTIEFTLRLVQTQDGWRFDEFHSALAEQKAPSEL